MSEPTDEQKRALEEWLADRPPVIQDLARRFPPWAWFRLKDERPGLYVYHTAAFYEDGTLRMAKYSVASGEGIIQVFGISPDDLEPCGSPEEERERLSAAEIAAGRGIAGLERAVHDHRLDVLAENPDAPPTTPQQATADYLANLPEGVELDWQVDFTEALESSPWVLTRDGKEVMRGEGLTLNPDGSFTLESLPEDDIQQ